MIRTDWQAQCILKVAPVPARARIGDTEVEIRAPCRKAMQERRKSRPLACRDCHHPAAGNLRVSRMSQPSGPVKYRSAQPPSHKRWKVLKSAYRKYMPPIFRQMMSAGHRTGLSGCRPACHHPSGRTWPAMGSTGLRHNQPHALQNCRIHSVDVEFFFCELPTAGAHPGRQIRLDHEFFHGLR